MKKTVRYVRRHKIALLGAASAATLIVFQHQRIKELVETFDAKTIDIGATK